MFNKTAVLIVWQPIFVWFTSRHCHSIFQSYLPQDVSFAMLWLLFGAASAHVSCKNPDGNDVPWWVMFKKPTSRDYYYRDPNTPLSAGPGDLGQKSRNPFYQSVKGIYERSTVAYLLINDQAPTGDATKKYAHDKGVILYDSDDAVYIEHSVPSFPPASSDGYSYPSSGVSNGQSFMCVSLSLDQLNDFANDMLVEIPYVYDSSIPSEHLKIQGISDIIDEKWRDSESTVSHRAGPVQHFVKSRHWGKDSYHDLLVTELGADGYSETWQNGSGGVLRSDCSGSHSVYNIQKVKFPDAEWVSTKDHSKWALIGDNVCIGGVNRVQSQSERGGQHLCLEHSGLAGELRDAIEEYEKC